MIHLSRFTLFACLTFVFLSLAPTAFAASGQSAADRETAKLLGREGHAALQAKDYEKAADRLERANNLIHAPTFLLLLARARIGQGRLVEAYDLYREIIRETVDPKLSAFKKAVRNAKKEVGPLKARLAKVSVQIDGPLPRGVKITLNGVNVPRAALGAERLVDPGRVVARAKAPGHRAAKSKSILLKEGQQGPVLRLRLTALPKAASLKPKTTIMSFDQDHSNGTTQRTLGYVSLGLGAASLAVGSVTGTLALIKHSELLELCDPEKSGCMVPSTNSSLKSEYLSYADTTTIALAAGGTLVAAGIALLLTAPDDESFQALKPRITPFVGLGTIGAVGQF